MYTHFHYVAGTATAVLAAAGHDIPIHEHSKIVHNRSRTASEIAPAYSRGIVEQFGLALDHDGPDGLVNVGLGPFFRNPAHAPFSPPASCRRRTPSMPPARSRSPASTWR